MKPKKENKNAHYKNTAAKFVSVINHNQSYNFQTGTKVFQNKSFVVVKKKLF